MSLLILIFDSNISRTIINIIEGIFIGGGSLFLVAGTYYLITGKEGMGGGDIKLMAMIGAWLGPRSIFPVIMIASISGIIVGIILMLKTKAKKGTPIPFGPFLSFGAVFYLIFPYLIPSFLIF